MISVRAPRPALIGAAAAAAIGLPGCGEATVTARPGAPLSFTLREYSISPQQLRARAGRVTIGERNTGVLVHQLRITAGSGSNEQTVALLPPLRHGQSASLTLTLRAGTYRLVCAVSGHDGLGEHGRLVLG